jgi:SAM-dependent methyltransferase
MAANLDDDPLFPQNDAVAAALLDRAYIAQTQFFFGRELSVFRRCSWWQHLTDVLDIGTGNGYFLQRLGAVFKRKRFTGIDPDRIQLAIARASNDYNNIQFRCAGIEEIEASYDAILMRFVAQHLPDLSDHMSALRSHLRPKGVLYLTEGDDTLTLFDPQPDAFRGIFKALARQRTGVGADLDIVKTIPAIADNAGFQIIEVCSAQSISTDVGGSQRMFEMELSILAYLRYVRVVEADYERAKQELLRWYSSDEHYGEETLRIFKLKPR